jgi:sarcosine oxidase subunit alpha
MTAERTGSPGPHEAIDRGVAVAYTLDGTRMTGWRGDTVGSAMAAAGVTITGRSFKYHRPRGLMCMAGACPNCLVRIDGVPNVRACTEPLREGMKVERQNGRPNVERDVTGIVDRFSFALPAGFYYKIFHRPAWVWPRVEPSIRRLAGLGVVPDEPDHAEKERVNLHPDVLVVGGGAAGLCAAVEAARAGAATVLLEERGEVGGALLYSTEWAADPFATGVAAGAESLPGPALAARLSAFAEVAGVRVLRGTPAFGVFDGPLVAAASANALYRIRPGRTIFATGAVEQPAVFPDNDLPGVILGGAADRLLNRFGILPGKRVVVLALGPAAYRTASSLAAAGAQVTVVDPDPGAAASRVAGITVTAGSTVRRAIGKRRVTAVEVGHPDEPGSKIDCDLVVVAGHAAPTTNLLAQAGATIEWDQDAGAFLPTRLPAGVFAAGEVTGVRDLDSALVQGRLAGLEASRSLGLGDAHADAAIAALRANAPSGPAAATLPAARIPAEGKQFACVCMDVTYKELRFAVKEGFDSIELLKRYTTLSMGPCQGKSCLSASIRLCALATHRSVPETGSPTARPPWIGVPMSVLAGEELVPRRESAMQDLHADLGAAFMWAGDWRRPHHYIEPSVEARIVHQSVGVIDVSTLGKVRVKGPDAAAFLERLYPNMYADLAVGRVRYGVMLNDSGVILDDGTIVRLAEDEFFVTTTTGNAASMIRWMEWWLAVWQMDVLMANVSSQYAALNVTGPRSREVMSRLTALDVSADGMPYLRAAQADVAGVPALILRIGFTGELGFELHVPAAYGQYLWQEILAASDAAGIQVQPFGLEAQRILRLEKQHILVGQDTDALSDPYGVGMSWIVKMAKPDFLGRQALAEMANGDAAPSPADRLVGWVAPGNVVPPEGAGIVQAGTWVGRVTSARRSDAVGSVIGMGWVPASFAEEDREISIHFGGQTLAANVRLKPFYDPEGTRLRS